MDRCPQCKRELKRRPRKPATRVNGSTRAEERAAKREAHRVATAALREAVFRRAAGLCEMCGGESGQPPSEMHHLLGGGGRRRALQSERNCVAACWTCHRRWHREGAKAFVWTVREWAERHGYSVPISITRLGGT